ncbi:MAG TPA: cytochrome P450 [Acidimicrobiales bacterium]|nr:cytochrome P450 [Acidimicrobiales bacterium]
MTRVDAPRIDLLSADSFAHGQPHEQFAWLRANDPVHWHDERNGAGFWAVTRYRDVKAVGRDSTTFSSTPTILIPDGDGSLEVGDHQMMLTMDQPRHTNLRKVVAPDFIPRAAKAMRPRIDALATRIIDGVAARGECDLVEDVAGLMPSYVIADMLGIPHKDGVSLYRLTETIHAAPESLPAGAALQAVLEMFNYAREVWERKRAEPADDLATVIAQASIDGHNLDVIDFNLFFLLLIDAGGDTTRNLVAGGMDALFGARDQLDWLAQDFDARVGSGVEELLRWVSPVVYMRRTATHDTELHGRPIKSGDKVVMYYGSANRDRDAFGATADELKLNRTPNEHVAFGGGGPHFCLGAHIARQEIHAIMRELLMRLREIEPAGDTEWLPSTFISGPKHLPIRFRT